MTHHTRLVCQLVLSVATLFTTTAVLPAQSFFISTSSPTVDKVSAPATVNTFATLPGNATSEGLAIDASGNLYVADGVGSQVFQVTSAGVVTVFAALAEHPSGLAFDDSGNLFAVGADSNGQGQICQITPAGVVSPFATLDANSFPQGMAFSGGNLYVADNGNTSQLLQVTSAGVVSVFAALPANSGPLGVAVDSTGNIYVSLAFLDEIDQVTNAGVVSAFATLPANSFPFGLAFDESGNLFSANSGGGDISKITPSGVVTVFATGVGAPEYLISAPAVSAVPGVLANISTRVQVSTSDQVLIAGFIIQGADAKQVILRGIGPSLTKAGVVGALANPTIELRDGSGALIGSNDDWMTTEIGGVITSNQKGAIQKSGVAPTNAKESAIIATLAPGSYTAVIRGAGSTGGVGLAEIYDLAPSSSKLPNLSSRGLVQTGENVMIGGVIIAGQPAQTLVRAIGPSLTDLGVAGALADPTLELFDGDGNSIAVNDDWKSDQKAEIQATMLAPTDPRESAILATLPPAHYTAVVRGAGDTTGVGLVEFYNLD